MSDARTWATGDPLGEALHHLHMSGTFYCRSEFTAPWGLTLPPLPDCLMFHVVTSGRCWLEVPQEAPRLLQPGDLALLPRGEGHRLVHEPGASAAALFALPREPLGDQYELLRHGGGGAAASLVCGAVRFDAPAARRLVALLPRCICIEAHASPQLEWMQTTLRLMADEAARSLPGGATVVTRLADILVIQAIRAWLRQDPSAHTGWLGALQDRHIGRALALMHRDPARPWTLQALAAEVAMSRSAFAAHFKARVGVPAMQYLAQWRMQLAAGWLQAPEARLAEVAGRVGYQSEAAFSRAFKRCNGHSPGAVRHATPAAPGPG